MSAIDRGEPKLIFPGLAEFYTAVSDLWYPMIRITVGAIMLVHGWGKIANGISPLASYLGRVGFPEAHIKWRELPPGLPNDWRGMQVNLPEAVSATKTNLPLEVIPAGRTIDDRGGPDLRDRMAAWLR